MSSSSHHFCQPGAFGSRGGNNPIVRNSIYEYWPSYLAAWRWPVNEVFGSDYWGVETAAPHRVALAPNRTF
jgi:hypothetical protein